MDREKMLELANDIEREMHAVMHASKRMRGGVAAELKPSEHHTFMMLFSMNGGQRVMPSVMARAMGISLPAITHQIKALEKHGYVVREASATDRRRVYVSITEKGYLLMERMKQDRMKLLLDFIEFLGEEDSQKLLEIISRIREYVRIMKETRNNEQKGQKK